MSEVASRSMIGVDKRIPMREVNRLVHQIVEKFDPDRVILFGSYAHGKPKPWSDVDLLVVMDVPGSNREQAARIAQSLSYRFGLDPLVRSQKLLNQRLRMGDFFIADILDNGKTLYARNNERVGIES